MGKKISVLGDDLRLKYASEKIMKSGLYINSEGDDIYDADYYLLPVPVTTDNLFIKGTKIKLSDFMEKLRTENVVFCGMPPKTLVNYCNVKKIICYDYMSCEYLKNKNAILTAKGIVSEAYYSGAVINRSSCLVIGYGHCGKKIARELSLNGAVCDIMVRRNEAFEEVRNDGFDALFMFDMLDENSKKRLIKYSYIFNTVPSLVLNPSSIKLFSDNIMIFDIASKPGGCDFDYCHEKGIFARLSLGIPGRHYPKEAGEIIAGVILDMVNI